MSLRPGRAGVDMQLAEIAAEPLVGLDVHRLIAKEQNLVLRERLMQLLDLAVAERIGELDAFNQGTDARRNRRNLDGCIAHGRPSILLETTSARAGGTRAHCAMAIPAIQYDQSPLWSVSLGAGELHRLGPFLGLLRDEPGKVVRG